VCKFFWCPQLSFLLDLLLWYVSTNWRSMADLGVHMGEYDGCVITCERRGSLVRTSVFGCWTFPDLCLIYGWHVTTSWEGVRCGSTNQANSAFHPCGVGKWVVIYAIRWGSVLCFPDSLAGLRGPNSKGRGHPASPHSRIQPCSASSIQHPFLRQFLRTFLNCQMCFFYKRWHCGYQNMWANFMLQVPSSPSVRNSVNVKIIRSG